jgi:hypothetical protein
VTAASIASLCAQAGNAGAQNKAAHLKGNAGAQSKAAHLNNTRRRNMFGTS